MASSLLISQTVKYNQNQGNILTNGGGKQCLKLHKYTLKLYKYAALDNCFSMWGGVLRGGRFAKLKPKIFGIAF